MTPIKLAEYVRYMTRTNSVTLTNAELITLANTTKDELSLKALDADEDIFLLPTYLNLVANQREYPVHSDILSRIKRVEAKLDGSNFIKLYEFDLPQYKGVISTEADIVANFSNEEGNAYYDIMRKALWIYSGTISNVTAGLKIWLNTFPADISSMESAVDMSVDPTTTTHGFPRELHSVLATGMIIKYKESREKPIPLTKTELKYDVSVNATIETLKKSNYDRQVLGQVPVNDGSEY